MAFVKEYCVKNDFMSFWLISKASLTQFNLKIGLVFFQNDLEKF